MTTPNIVELAKQGNPKAIAAIINRQLQSKGITAKATFRDGCLYLTLEADRELKQEIWVEWVRKGLLQLGTKSIKSIKLYGQNRAKPAPSWSHSFDLIDANTTNQMENVTSEPVETLPQKIEDLDREVSKTQEPKPSNPVETNQLNIFQVILNELSEEFHKANFVEKIKEYTSGLSKTQLLMIGGAILVVVYLLGKLSGSRPQPQIVAPLPLPPPVSSIPSQPTIEQPQIEIDADEKIEFLRQYDGQLHLVAQDGQYLGLLSRDRQHQDSICNPYGDHGGEYNSNSIRNKLGSYGSDYGSNSPYNRYASSPPLIVYNSQPIAVVSRNP
ncbi:MAG TPA: hypothetical protein IGS17_03705 [Oscillatoriales cyanobacterium M59_W2019_021]|nr:hypothetical protein [Oscillatoriales cyanobacterium M59_W2019_021]